ncbi:MAG: hypothetical protein JSV49_07130 [Thermoplasmata archaeon]|nr:MAG: hypothetical protein JSV49_07130 [Thermoplasmata archaeon]
MKRTVPNRPNRGRDDARSKRHSSMRMYSIFRMNRKAVSEALGTILLMGVAIVLVSAMFVWTQLIPKLEEGNLAHFNADYADGNITITHMGGDELITDETEIRVRVDSQTLKYELSSDPAIDEDKRWRAGESWIKEVEIEVTPDSELEVQVIDTGNQMVLFSDELYTKTTQEELPDLSVVPDNITFNYPGNMIRRYIWTNITVRISNLGTVDVSNAVVRLFVGSTPITKDGRDQILVDVPADSTVSVWVNWTPREWGLQTIFVKLYSGYSEIDYSNNYAFEEILVDIQTILIHGPDLQLTSWDILMYPEFPTRGDDVKVTIIVHNLGDEPVQSKDGATLVIRDTEIQWNTTTDKAMYTDGVFLNQTFYNVSIPANGIVYRDFVWTARPGGNVTLYTYIDVNNSVIETPNNDGALEYNNLATRIFKIMPKILLVDDDNITSGESDSGSKLRHAMIAAGATFDMYITSGNADPYYDSGSKQLKDYDIVVWTTGYEKENTLSAANIATLKRAMVNGTYLWLVGQDIVPELTANLGDMDSAPDPGEFVYDFLGVKAYTQPENGTPELLEGIDTDPISTDLRLNLSSIWLAEDRGINISAFKNDSISDGIAGIFYNTSELGPGGNASIRYYNITTDFKTVYFGFEFSSINNPVIRAQVAFRVLKWLNWTLTFGTDFAVAEETFSKAEPKYLDRVWINATILNNGPEEMNVTVAFYVTGPDGLEKLIPQYPDMQKNPYTIIIEGGGGKYPVSKEWLATEVGLHNFRVVVDPFDAHEEISEENNDITYTDLNTELDIAFAILVVDDDNSTNNNGNDVDMVSSITEALDILEYDYDFRIVQGGGDPKAGPDVEILKHYNAVIWCTGTTGNHTLNVTDQYEIEKYLTGVYEEAAFIENLRVNFLLIGTNVLEDLNGSGTNMDPSPDAFVEKYLHVDRYTTNQTLNSELHGIVDHPVTHGLDYELQLYGSGAPADITTDAVVPTSDATGLFWRTGAHTSYAGVSYNSSEYKVVFIPWAYSAIAPSNIGMETNQSEFMFLIMNWFAYPEKRIELRTYGVDITLNDDNPVIGASYVLRTNVFNYGGRDTSAIVRYYDKNTIIDTQTIYVPADGNSTSEIIWVPLFAGNRTLNVKVDAANDVPEIFEYINNNASRPNEEVFFFYDDMEMGTSNWNHESVLYRIRGESPLDYMDQPVHTTINGTWDQVSGFKNYTFDYHSSNTSFFASEPGGSTSKPILDIVFVFDTSNSMAFVDGVKQDFPDRPIDLAKEAARYLLDYVHDESRVMIYKTAASEIARNVTRDLGWTTLDKTGRDLLMNDPPHYLSHHGSSSAELDPSSWTLIWWAMGDAVEAGIGMGRKGKTVVITLSDGADYKGSDNNIDISKDSSFDPIEMGSASNGPAYGWCPWRDFGTQDLIDFHWGKYFGDSNTPGYWFNQTFGPPVTKQDYARGLLRAPIPIYTIGLTLETATNRSGDINEPDFVEVSSAVNFRDRHGDVLIHPNGNESGTPEFNLYRVATTSHGKYYYAEKAEDLKDIFGKIREDITALLTRGTPLSRATDIGIETKYALTGEFSLVGMDSAKLTFYHKFKLNLGYNGAIVRIGMPNATGGWAYKYIEPSQMYNSNLYLQRTEYDDFGTPMLWCWNGVSGGGLYEWEYAEFDLSQFIGQPRLRMNFTLVLYGGGDGGGWWIDDVEVRVTRSNMNPVTDASKDQWEWTEHAAHSGSFSWWNHNATTENLTGGLDNSLYTRSIDLTRARNATLTAYLRFNINASGGRPPDGFRVEVSADNGRIWKPLNLGSRAAWGVSGDKADITDGVLDGRSVTGLDPDGDGWVECGTLTRLDTDLSGWRGSVIKIRFRVVTAVGGNPYWSGEHYDDPDAGFGGLYIDDVIVYGESIEAESEKSTRISDRPGSGSLRTGLPVVTVIEVEESSGESPQDTEVTVEEYAESPEGIQSHIITGPPALNDETYEPTVNDEGSDKKEVEVEPVIVEEDGSNTEDNENDSNLSLAALSSSLCALILIIILLIGKLFGRYRRR